jgi:hypothetical protein
MTRPAGNRLTWLEHELVAMRREIKVRQAYGQKLDPIHLVQEINVMIGIANGDEPEQQRRVYL